MTVTPLEFLEQTASRVPEKVAVEDENTSLTFLELLLLARSVGTYLSRTLDVTRKGIAVYTERNIYCVAAFLGVLYSGNYYVPVDSGTPLPRLDIMLEPVKPVAVLVTPDTPDALSAHEVNGAVKIDFDDAAACEIDDDLLRRIRERVIDADLAYAMFTSGSTGVPKAAAIRNRGIVDLADWLTECFGFTGEEIIGNQTPFFFDASVKDIYLCLKTSATLVILPKKLFVAPVDLIRYITERNIDTILWATSAVRLVAESGIFDKIPAPQLKNVFFAGENMLGKHLNIWRNAMPDARFVNLYGPTETAVDCTYFVVNREFSDGESVPIGRPCRNKDVFLVKDGAIVQNAGITGEIVVRGSSVSPGYIGLPERTQVVFTEDVGSAVAEIVYKTGDLARYDDFGDLVYVSRADSQIKHMGARVELGEVESAASVISGVHAAICLYDDKRREIILAYGTDDATEREVLAALRKNLPRYMLPARVVRYAALPVTPNGKADRVRLREELIDKYSPD